MPNESQKLLITRSMPENVAARAARRFDVTVNAEDVVRPIDTVLDSRRSRRNFVLLVGAIRRRGHRLFA